ncbi:IreB family regulatory phosphoprotein [Candidatus Saccharibacteria bacterium]|nr:IreB family regulatory phosphoprotein [Candidatus Saccharibacteria bacterium]
MLNEEQSQEILMYVFEQLKIAGYNPIAQISGYLMTEDPTYITSHGGARYKITRLDRHDVLAWMMGYYLNGLESPK